MTETIDTAQPEALRLADAIDPFTRKFLDNLTCSAAAAELRRLQNALGMAVSDAQRSWRELAAAEARNATLTDDAARWQETLMHVGAANHLGGQHFTLNSLRIRDQMFLLRGSVAQHFTACIDDSRAAKGDGQ